VKLFFLKISNLPVRDHDTSTLQTDRQTDNLQQLYRGIVR